MAEMQMGPVDTNFVDKRRTKGDHNSQVLAEAANYGSIANLKARLTALNATSYSAARLASMSVNDMVYALRTASADSAGIK